MFLYLNIYHNKYKYRLYFITITLIICMLLTACNQPKEASTSEPIPASTSKSISDSTISTASDTLKDTGSIRVAALLGPTGMGMAQLIDLNDQNKSINSYDFTLAANPDDIVSKILNKEIDIAAVPTNLASILYQRTNSGIQLAAVNTLGVLYLLENTNYTTNKSVESDLDKSMDLSFLQDKIVNISGKGATPDFAFRYILQKNNLIPDIDMKVNYAMQHADLATAMSAGQYEYAVLPEPHVTTALLRNNDLRIALDLTKEWHKVTEGKDLIMGVIIVQKDFVENNQAKLKIFLEEYRTSVNYINNNLSEAARIMVKHKILPAVEIAEQAIPNCNIVYIDAIEAKSSILESMQVLYEFEPKAIGGKLPDEDFWYNQ